MAGRLTRRRFLAAGVLGVAGAGGLGLGLVEGRVLPGRGRLHRLLGLTGPDGVVPSAEPGPSVSGSFVSSARRATVGWTIVYPPGVPVGASLPVVLLLHARGSDHRFAVSALGVDRYLAAGGHRLALAAWTVVRTATGIGAPAATTRRG